MQDASIEPKPATDPLLATYQQGESNFDEFLTESGEPRAHYARFFGMLKGFGPGEMLRRAENCQRLLNEQGVAYNVYGDPRGMERPWQIDPLPLIIPPQEWSQLEHGLIQRATLLNEILEDCYGRQELIHTRWLSPALVFGQPDFLRPCHGIQYPSDTLLHFYAADLARAPDGQWWVISDRAQIPTGAGYTLANRLVTSRVFPESFREHRVHRLAGFFRDMRNALVKLSPRGPDNARVVMLTPGPHNETYFEQAYLSRYLGYTLVEGQDLTVRDNQVWLKTLSGLEPVDVIIRRVDDDFCDPLELRNDSILGVAGLVEAIRAGTVVVTNALGSGLVQSPAFMSFLPGLCQHILGEELELPSVATWWCGQASARNYVLDNLEELFVKPAFRTHQRTPDPAKPLSIEELDQLRRQILFNPDLFVAQERVGMSSAPSWNGRELVAKPIGLRVFVVATENGYRVMPGGMTRVAPAVNGKFISMQHGSSSKDTWVLSEQPVEPVTLLQSPMGSTELRRTGNNLPSRLADNFFWLGRYSERADATARLLRISLSRFNPERSGNELGLVAPLLQTLEAQGQLPGSFTKPELRQNAEAFEAELLAAIFDPGRPGSLRQIADHLQRLAILVRDRTSNDMWRVLSRLNDRLTTPTSSMVMLAGDAAAILNETLIGLAAFHGLARENMTRAQAWRFLDIGLRLERAVYLSTLLDATLRATEAENPSVLEPVLEVADCAITFRARYNLLATVPAVFDLVLLDDKNPRSVLFQLNQLAKHFGKLPGERDGEPGSVRELLAHCVKRLNQTDARELATRREFWLQSGLSDSIRHVRQTLPEISNLIAATYFAHAAISRTGRGSEA